MSEQHFDLTEAIYSIGDVASDSGQAAARLRGLLARLESGAQPAAQQPGMQHQTGGDPSGAGGSSSVVGGEATPYPELEAFSIGQFGERVDQVMRQVAVMGDQDGRDALWTFAQQVNRSLDEHAGRQTGQVALDPLAGRRSTPATSDEELGDLAGRIEKAAGDPGGHDELGHQHERKVDELHTRRDACGASPAGSGEGPEQHGEAVADAEPVGGVA